MLEGNVSTKANRYRFAMDTFRLSILQKFSERQSIAILGLLFIWNCGGKMPKASQDGL